MVIFGSSTEHESCRVNSWINFISFLRSFNTLCAVRTLHQTIVAIIGNNCWRSYVSACNCFVYSIVCCTYVCVNISLSALQVWSLYEYAYVCSYVRGYVCGHYFYCLCRSALTYWELYWIYMRSIFGAAAGTRAALRAFVSVVCDLIVIMCLVFFVFVLCCCNFVVFVYKALHLSTTASLILCYYANYGVIGGAVRTTAVKSANK